MTRRESSTRTTLRDIGEWLFSCAQTRARFVFAVGLTLCAACSPPAYPSSAPHPLLEQPLPRIAHRRALDGRELDSTAFAGRPVVVKFFADFCEPCKASLPAAERVHRAEANVLFVGVDEDESIATAESVVARYGLSFPVVHDTANAISGRYRVGTMPMTFVADGRGIIRWVGDEHQTEQSLVRAVEAASR